MKLRRFGQTKNSQKGFTLVELTLVIAIAGLIGGGITMAISQTFTVNALSTAHMTAVKEVENAIHWIIPDAQMAQEKLVDGTMGVNGALEDATNGLTLRWSHPWVNTSDEVTYLIVNGQLKRTYSHTDEGGNTSTEEAVVAQNIDIANTSSVYADGVLTFKITATVGGMRPASETRSFQVILRSEPNTS